MYSPIILGLYTSGAPAKEVHKLTLLSSSLITLCPSLRNIKAFGSDCETQFSRCSYIPEGTHLRCFCYFQANLVSKLTGFGLPCEIINQYMKDVFGKRTDRVHEVGLVDMMDVEVFEQKIEALHETWDQQEVSVAPHRSPVFFN